MYCVIQEIKTKRENKNGYAKELLSEFMSSSIGGRQQGYYYHSYSSEYFERPVKKAYKISIHKSYRENGAPKKKQFTICTANYYDLATDFFSLYEWGHHKIEQAAEALEVSIDEIYKLIEDKLEPLETQIKDEFYQTEEYITHQEHERITTLYTARKVKFNEQYQVDGHTYDECYDVFGNLQNPQRLEEIKTEFKSRQAYEERSRGYSENFYSNYSDTNTGSGYYENNCSNYKFRGYNKEILKQFYRTLCKRYHPDSNPDCDTSKEMQMLNELKEEWGV